MINDKYHIQYDFMYLARLSYPLRVSRRADPVSGCSGSAFRPPARSGLKTQYVLRHRLIFLLYIVFAPCPVTGRSAPVKGGVVIPWAWYTSGKLS